MTKTSSDFGLPELRAARRENRALYWAVGLFSFFVNLLMLTGPIYMLQVYDRVLGSRSEATLIALTLIVAFLYGMMGILDYVRGRVMARAAARFQSQLDRRVFDAVMRRSALGPDTRAQTGLSDLESIQRLMSSPVLMAGFDIPWTPIFLAAISLFHPWLGMLAVGGGVLLIMITLANQILSKRPTEEAASASNQANLMSGEIRSEAELMQTMGLRNAAFTRWQKARGGALSKAVDASDVSGSFTATTKTLRLFLQSAMLGLGAYLVLQNELTAGAMIAASILLGRALAPIELAIGQWAVVQRARRGWRSLASLLAEVHPEAASTALPVPKAELNVKALTVVPPGERKAVLRGVSFVAEPGQAVGVIGPSGSGKSTLARALAGIWLPAGGEIRLGGATLGQYSSEALGHHVGYLPQRPQMFTGTIAENIARLSTAPDDKQVVIAAQKAAAHEMILTLPEGYDTQVTGTGGRLSGGQMQRVGLARALYGDPVVVILDEPNSNLDSEGSQALNQAIRQLKADGKIVLIMAHRPAAIEECDMLLALTQGTVAGFGSRDTILRQITQNLEKARQQVK